VPQEPSGDLILAEGLGEGVDELGGALLNIGVLLVRDVLALID
jgi:hypothetical protein